MSKDPSDWSRLDFHTISVPPSPTRHRMSQFLEGIAQPFSKPWPFAYFFVCLLLSLFFQYTSSLFTFITVICSSEFSSDTFAPGSFLASSAPLRRVASPVCSSLPYLWLSVTIDHQGQRQKIRGREQSEVGYLFPTSPLLGHCRLTVSYAQGHSSCQSVFSIQVSLWVLTVLSPFLFTQRHVMPPHGSWPQSTMVIFLHLAHICVNSAFINSPQLPSLGCPLFPAETLCDT